MIARALRGGSPFGGGGSAADNGTASELGEFLDRQLGSYDLAPLEEFSFGLLLERAVSGQLDLSPFGIAQSALQMFFREMFANGALIRQLLVIAVISALIRCLASSLKRQQVGELGFYVSYILLIAVVVSSFRLAVGILEQLVGQIMFMMEAAVPLLIGLTAMSGQLTAAAVMQPVLWMGMALMARFIAVVFIPLTTAAAVLHLVNHLVEGDVFGKISGLMKKCAGLMLKFLVFAFLSVLTLQKISAPIANNLAINATRAATGAVPVVGDALSSAMDTVLHLGSAARSGVLVALVIVILAAVSVPLLKLLTFVAVYKLVAAVIQPVCDKRLVDCLDGLADYIGLLLGGGVLVALMFIFATVILLV